MTSDSQCELCKVNPATVNDHCHYHDTQRGRLCNRCNILLGRVDSFSPISESVTWLVSPEAVAEYRAKCDLCGYRPIPEIIHEYSLSIGPISDLALHPVSPLPEPAELIRLRTQNKLSQSDLAETLKVSRRTIYSWEHGISEPHGRKRVMYAEVIALWRRREREVKPDGE